MSEKAIHGLACPNCAGMLTIPEGLKIITCPYCEMRSLVKGERGMRRYQVKRQAQRAQAETALKSFLSGKMQIARNAARTSTIQESFLAYLPFWSSWSRVLGWAFGEEEVGSGDDKRYEPREIKIAQEMNWTGAALDVGEFGVESISLHGRELDAFNPDELHGSGMVFESIGSASDAAQNAERDFIARVSKLADLDRTSQVFTRTIRKRFGLVYYPLWIVRYLYRGRAFQVVVDGHDGKVLYGKAPGSTLFRSIALVAGMALGAILAVDGGSGAVYMAFNSNSDDAIGYLVIGGLVALGGGFGLMAAGYRAFRYGEQYEFRGYTKKRRSIRSRSEGGVRRVVEEQK